MQNPQGNGSQAQQQQQVMSAPSSLTHRQQHQHQQKPSSSLNNNEASNSHGHANSSHVTAAKTYASIVKPATEIYGGQCIPGSASHVSVKCGPVPSMIIEDFWNRFNIFVSI